MKAFNLKAITKIIAGSEKTVIQLGEEGRGRKSILVKCEAGIQDGENVTVKIPKPGMPGVPQITRDDQSPGDGWISRVSTNGAYIRGAQGNVRYLTASPAVTAIAKGHGAFGDAGRTGTWDDVLLQVPIGAVLRVKPSRGDAYFLRFDSDSVQKLTAEEAAFEGIETEKESYTKI